MTVCRGTVRTGDRQAARKEETAVCVRMEGTTEAVRMEDREEIVRATTAGTVRRGTVRTEDPAATARAASAAGDAGTVRRADVRTTGADRAAGIPLAVR